MSKTWKWMLAAALVAGGVAPWTRVWADDEEPDPDRPELKVQHADCEYLGPQRDRWVRGGLRAAELEAAALARMTDEVAQSLPPTPSRSRTGALNPRGGPLRPPLGPLTDIDQIIFTALRENNLPMAEPATDQEFLRRVSLDLTGRIPTAPEVVTFLADATPNKRAALVDRLLSSAAWVDKWTMYFGDLYGNTANTANVNRYPDGRNAFYRYLKSSMEQNKPYDLMARELLSAAGTNSYTQGELNFVIGGRTPGGPLQDTYDAQARETSSIFLGIAHLDCLLCHDGRGHLDSLSLWGRTATRAQAWGLSGFFARTQLAQTRVNPMQPNPYYWSVLDNTGRATVDYTLNTTNGNRPDRLPRPGQSRTVPPTYPFGGRANPGEAYRPALARILTADLQFARAAVNYLWKEFFGLGIVDPPDQFDPARLDWRNPPPDPWKVQPSNPQLLEKLAQDFVATQYDLKTLMRRLLTSQTYQLSARYPGQWNPAWDRYYGRKLVRRLDAEELHDAIVQASGIPASYNIAGIGTVQWAMQFPEPENVPGRANPVSGFLDSFLRGNREDVKRSRDTTLQQAVDLMNDPLVLNRARATPATGTLGRNLNLPDEQLIDALFLNVLSRFPSAEERAAAAGELRSGNRTMAAQNLMWALFNKADFIFNY